MHESAEVDYREIQYGVRKDDGEVKRLRIGPNEAAKWLATGRPIVQREVTHYLPDASEWHHPASLESGAR